MINAFNDVPGKPFPKNEGLIAGADYLDNVAAVQIGEGAKVFRGDRSGIWLGAEDFANAPFSVDMEGNVTATSLSLSGYLSKTDTGQALSGSIIINDGSNDRILIGFQSGGF